MCLSVVFFKFPVLGVHQAYWICVFIVVAQSLSHVQLFVPPWTAAHQASLSFTVSPSLLKFMSIESVMLSNHLIVYRPLLLLPLIFPSIRVFSNESALCIRWPKYWSFNFSITLSNEYSENQSNGFSFRKRKSSVFIIFIKFGKISTIVSSIFLPLCFQGLQIHVY